MQINRKNNGWIAAEVIAAMAIIVMVLGGLTISMIAFNKANKFNMHRLRCLAAANAQLDSLQTTKQAIDEDDINRLWPNIKTEITTVPGADQWEGFMITTVTAYNQEIEKKRVIVSRYIRTGQER